MDMCFSDLFNETVISNDCLSSSKAFSGVGDLKIDEMAEQYLQSTFL